MTRARECREVDPLIDELVDGALDDARARAVRAHARGCDACRRRIEATEKLVEASASLGPVDPPPSLWAGVAERLDREDAGGARPRWWWWWQAWRRPILAGAAVCAAGGLALAIALSRGGDQGDPEPAEPVEIARPETPPAPAPGESPSVMRDVYSAALEEVERADRDYRRAIDELRAIVKLERPRWDPAQARAFDENLAAIDAAVERQRMHVRREPANLRVVDALHASYRKQIDFLQESVLRGEVAP